MFGTMDLQIQYLLLLQHFREATHGIFDCFFMTMTWFGEFFIPVSFLAIIYWVVNKRAGTFLLYSFALTLYVNVFLKMAVCINRPWLIDERVCPLEKALPAADGYSFPSGHTAGATSVWGGTAFWWWKNRFVRYFALALVFLVALSRNYVGVHTPQDVIVSMTVGVGILFASDWILKWVEGKENRDIILFVVFSVLVMLLYFFLCIKCSLQMKHFDCLKDLVNPIEMKHGVYPKLGFCVGIFIGWIIERRFVGFSVPASLKNKLVTAFLGLGLMFLTAFVFKEVLALIFVHQIASLFSAFYTAFFIVTIYPLILKLVWRNNNSN